MASNSDSSSEYKKYNHAEALRQQIKFVNDKIGEADTEDPQSFEQYFNKVLMALSSLDAMSEPFKDDDYSDRIEEALEQGKPANMNKLEKLNFIHRSLTDLMELYYRENLFYDERHGRRNV